MDWETDRSLQLRMLATLGLIVVLPLVFTYTLAAALNWIVFPMVAENGSSPTISFNPLVVLGLTIFGMAIAYFKGGEMALSSTGARLVSEEDRPELHGRVQRLAATVGMAKPQVAIIDSNTPNAFATDASGREPTVAVTTGLLDTLDGEELDAVLAHELAHIKNRDATVMSIAYLLPTLTYIVSTVMFTFLRFFIRAFARPTRASGRNRGGGKAVIVVIVAAIVTLTVSAVFWLASNVLFRLLSQYREYAADRGAAAITGNPLALASALETIDGEMRSLPDRDLRDLDGGVEALYIASLELPMFNDDDDSLAGELLSQELFPASHPPTAQRIERLRALSTELEV